MDENDLRTIRTCLDEIDLATRRGDWKQTREPARRIINLAREKMDPIESAGFMAQVNLLERAVFVIHAPSAIRSPASSLRTMIMKALPMEQEA